MSDRLCSKIMALGFIVDYLLAASLGLILIFLIALECGADPKSTHLSGQVGKTSKTVSPFRSTKLICDRPMGTFEVSAKTKLKFVSVRVRNTGEFEARRVRIFVVLPNGETRRLSGPSSIKERGVALYERAVTQYIGSTKKLEAFARCDNCY